MRASRKCLLVRPTAGTALPRLRRLRRGPPPDAAEPFPLWLLLVVDEEVLPGLRLALLD